VLSTDAASTRIPNRVAAFSRQSHQNGFRLGRLAGRAAQRWSVVAEVQGRLARKQGGKAPAIFVDRGFVAPVVAYAVFLLHESAQDAWCF